MSEERDTQIWRQTRRNELMRQSPRCHYCDVLLIRWQHKEGYQPPTDYMRDVNGFLVGYATLDHIMPRVCGGQDTTTNTVLACAACNQRKGIMDYDEFLAVLWEVSQ